MSKILAIDSSNAHCSIALNSDGRITFRQSHEDRQHARRMLPMISSLLEEQGLRISELDAIAIVNGPGSFTGLRIGAGVAQGLAFGADIPILGISSLAVMAMKAHRQAGYSNLLICLAARDHEIYSGAYRVEKDDVALLGHEQVGPADLNCFAHVDPDIEWYAVGDAWRDGALSNSSGALRVIVDGAENCFPDAMTLSELAQIRVKNGLARSAQQALPVYLKEQMNYRD
ncbi:MAG: tRNA (adenosine(37)-N6)-threonylcarbamoyltransferase complex dimerization subunit type 1 TsaB [Gammaproteobacteria bacterium]|nr:tRNA (adenosine(37)-N6)-threonylcarbamoyltransferase complex dimerization subunit type 1 TsaB [Gammaproteobacteria bacterium]MDP2140941.1 tRNA (adenosine(37)-N6)-threonylcarbamoyltransferase complex dimerization subunit type 1 TsaB [Gammaproteobacteria bacterium]MDP2349315.1 tRNA (adenosine(37)-N6)-threonylcarbamoyltransferase complex dimerization subunit type 1 TsaB [Gammaproteobacteria bacterium]